MSTLSTGERVHRDPRPTWQPGPMPDAPPADLLAITCPRCARPASVRFYGPCEDCRTTLRVEQAHAAHDVEVAAYEPKMNVTPNAVALKE